MQGLLREDSTLKMILTVILFALIIIAYRTPHFFQVMIPWRGANGGYGSVFRYMSPSVTFGNQPRIIEPVQIVPQVEDSKSPLKDEKMPLVDQIDVSESSSMAQGMSTDQENIERKLQVDQPMASPNEGINVHLHGSDAGRASEDKSPDPKTEDKLSNQDL